MNFLWMFQDSVSISFNYSEFTIIYELVGYSAVECYFCFFLVCGSSAIEFIYWSIYLNNQLIPFQFGFVHPLDEVILWYIFLVVLKNTGKSFGSSFAVVSFFVIVFFLVFSNLVYCIFLATVKQLKLDV